MLVFFLAALGQARFNSPKPAPSNAARVHAQDIAQEGRDTYTRLKYHVEHQDRYFLHLDTDPDVQLVDCAKLFSGNVIEVSVSGSLASELLKQDDIIVTGGKCPKQGNFFSSLHKTFRAPKVVKQTENSVVLLLEVHEASYLDVYESATIHFQTNALTMESTAKAKEKETPTSASRSLLSEEEGVPVVGGWFGDSIRAAWAKVKTVASDVQKAVDTVKEATKVLPAWNYSDSVDVPVGTWTWNSDASGKIIITNTTLDPTVSCYNCHMVCSLAVNFSLSIVARKLQSLSVIAHGHFDASIGLMMTWDANFQKQLSKVIDTIRMKPISFMVGPVPFSVKATIPILAGYQFNSNAHASVTALATACSDFQAGVVVDEGGMSLVNVHDFHPGGSLSSVGHANFLGHVFLLPTMQVQIDYIGGPNVGLYGFLEAGGEFGLPKTDVCYPNIGKVTSNLGLQLAVGGTIDIHYSGVVIFHKDFPDVTIYSGKFPILSACVGASNSAAYSAGALATASREAALSEQKLLSGSTLYQAPSVVLTHANGSGSAAVASLIDSACGEGTTWAGSIKLVSPATGICAKYPSNRQISVQAVVASIPGPGTVEMDVVLSSNDAHIQHDSSSSFACVSQGQYSVVFTKAGSEVIFSRKPSTTVDYEQCSKLGTAASCTCTDKDVRIPDKFKGTYSPHVDRLELQDVNHCTSVHLYRVVPSPPASTAAARARLFVSQDDCGL